MKAAMSWAATKVDKIDLDTIEAENGTEWNGLIKDCPMIKEVDKILFEELIGMVSGNPAMMYLHLNSKRSGLEAWRGLYGSNDPNTYQQSELFLEIKDNCYLKRSKRANELQKSIAEFEKCCVQYFICTGKEYDNNQKQA